MKIYVYAESEELAGQIVHNPADYVSLGHKGEEILPTKIKLFGEGSEQLLVAQAWEILDSKPSEYRWRSAKAVLKELCGFEVVYSYWLRVYIPHCNQ